MEKKYEFIDETKSCGYHVLHRIRAVRSFGDVHKGDLGGFIESEYNLSHDGNCWVCCDAMVLGNAKVFDDARIHDNVIIRDSACVYGDAKAYGNARIRGNAEIYGRAKVSGDADICDNANVFANSYVCGNAKICSDAWIGGDATVMGNARISKNAFILSNKNYIAIENIGTRHSTITFYHGRMNEIRVNCWYFYGTLGDFSHKVKERYGNSRYAKEYKIAIKCAKCYLNLI